MDKLKCTNPECSSTLFCMMEVAPKEAEGQYFRAVTCLDCNTVYGIVEYENIGKLVLDGTKLTQDKLNAMAKKLEEIKNIVNGIDTDIGKMKK